MATIAVNITAYCACTCAIGKVGIRLDFSRSRCVRHTRQFNRFFQGIFVIVDILPIIIYLIFSVFICLPFRGVGYILFNVESEVEVLSDERIAVVPTEECIPCVYRGGEGNFFVEAVFIVKLRIRTCLRIVSACIHSITIARIIDLQDKATVTVNITACRACTCVIGKVGIRLDFSRSRCIRHTRQFNRFFQGIFVIVDILPIIIYLIFSVFVCLPFRSVGYVLFNVESEVEVLPDEQIAVVPTEERIPCVGRGREGNFFVEAVCIVKLRIRTCFRIVSACVYSIIITRIIYAQNKATVAVDIAAYRTLAYVVCEMGISLNRCRCGGIDGIHQFNRFLQDVVIVIDILQVVVYRILGIIESIPFRRIRYVFFYLKGKFCRFANKGFALIPTKPSIACIGRCRKCEFFTITIIAVDLRIRACFCAVTIYNDIIRGASIIHAQYKTVIAFNIAADYAYICIMYIVVVFFNRRRYNTIRRTRQVSRFF